MKEFWNERYGQVAYVYGETPNVFFKTQLEHLPAGNLLLPGEGEGRNAVHAAVKGWQVFAFDQSSAGREKALQLAEKNGVQIHYAVHSYEEMQYGAAQFDAIALVFAHSPANKRRAYHQAFLPFLKPGGRIILEGFSKNHLQHSAINARAGGPKDIHMLFSTEEIKTDFASLETILLTEEETELSEGLYHLGRASVVRYVGRKS